MCSGISWEKKCGENKEQQMQKISIKQTVVISPKKLNFRFGRNWHCTFLCVSSTLHRRSPPLWYYKRSINYLSCAFPFRKSLSCVCMCAKCILIKILLWLSSRSKKSSLTSSACNRWWWHERKFTNYTRETIFNFFFVKEKLFLSFLFWEG
jgi:hypothetical protein